jgi:UDP-glucose 4-epimerase
MRVLITGGAGFIGSHVADRLLARGDRVLVVDSYATGRRDNLSAHPGLRIVEGSIADPGLVDRCFEEQAPEVVVHAAASYKDPEDWAEDSRTNVLGTANVVRAARERSVARFLYFQTALCYGLRPLEQPITLDHPLRPEGSSYAISKTAGEHYVRLSGLDWVSFRLANAYGPRNVSGPLPTFVHRLTLGKPCFVVDTRRDFVFVDDLVDVVLQAIDGEGGAGAYHVSSGRDVPIQALFDATVKALGLTPAPAAELRPRAADDAATILLDPSRTTRDFDWRVRVPLEAGVRAAVDWYTRFGLQETYTHLKLPERR